MKRKTWRSSETRDKVRKLLAAENPVVICYDLETTGLKAGEDAILSIAAIKCQLKDGELIETGRLSSLVNPEREITEEITKINHISNEMVKDSPTMDEFFPKMCDFFQEADFISGYNVGFDNGFLNAEFSKRGKGFKMGVTVLDVIEMARDLTLPLDIKHLVGETTHPYKLCNVYTYYFGTAEDGSDAKVFHDSREDTEATLELMKKFLPMYEGFNADYDEADKVNPMLLKIQNWFNPNQKSMKRIKIYTNEVTFYYDKMTKRWGCWDEDDSPCDYDMEALRKAVLNRAGVKNESELSRWYGKTA